ncbi:translation initiation factor [Agrobacterium phage Atu_ph07]|uniref:Translation initiation factor 3 n=1 Tax=Agrobacterium phage Atu_ph07 TaxID=2024264 RepID=A0A2L0UZ54_9CAUD|nr:translation initiation factor [Agrobacterium phage Atu_ph07]AUZ94813.1 translation initiation factor 3 [Agrobacterium phage Atu_ph07]
MNKISTRDDIKSSTIRLVDGEETTVLDIEDALDRAFDAELDLVLISDKGDIPVCKIIDYGKFQYENEKRQKEIKKNSRKSVSEVKEIQLRPVTDTRDIQIKAKKAKGFLNDGDKVRVVIRFKGRETSHKELGQNILNTFLESVGVYEIDSPTSDLGRDLAMTIRQAK